MRALRLIFVLLVGTCCTTLRSAFSIDPFSKIIITSDTAACEMITNAQDALQKAKKKPEHFSFTYKTNVRVTFADQSTITADALDIDFDVSATHGKGNALDNFKKITFINHVCITNAQRKATADRAELYLKEKKCALLGNVKIQQTRQKVSDIPIVIESQRADFDMANSQLSLSGSQACPVSTTIILDGHPALGYKKDLDKKNKKKHGKNKSTSTGNGT